jgi:hypothetical protein
MTNNSRKVVRFWKTRNMTNTPQWRTWEGGFWKSKKTNAQIKHKDQKFKKGMGSWETKNMGTWLKHEYDE